MSAIDDILSSQDLDEAKLLALVRKALKESKKIPSDVLYHIASISSYDTYKAVLKLVGNRVRSDSGPPLD